MENTTHTSRRIKVLRDSVARRIAAGEVIDRPQAVVRELLDNAIDAGSGEISLDISGGGISEIRVTDNGCGMDADDLRMCFLPHATSKIEDFEDIYRTRSLGFRGEALASVAACSRLEIRSSVSDRSPAMKLTVRDGKIQALEETEGNRGTIVSVKDLFYSMPGRKRFLKSAGAEAGMCRSVFTDKALPQLDITFRYKTDGCLKLFLPASDLKTRICSAYGGIVTPEFINILDTEIDGIRIKAAAGGPSLYRKDRKYIHIFINNRRITDYSLVQAVDYAYEPFLPGGCHPVCFLFLDMDPSHVDFNIHPAKREVKFRDLPGIHHTVTTAVGNFLAENCGGRSHSPAAGFSNFESVFRPSAASSPPVGQTGLFDNAFEHRTPVLFDRNHGSGTGGNPLIERRNELRQPAEYGDGESLQAPLQCPDNCSFLYLGQLFNLFLLFEQGDDLLLIDQHAAHERIIFDRLNNSPPKVQELLIPLRFTVEDHASFRLRNAAADLEKLGFVLTEAGGGEWCIEAMPEVCSGMEDDVAEFFRDGGIPESELRKSLYAMISCKSAIKDGDRIGSMTALELAEAVLKLENPRCPHGRPVMQRISRDQLFRMFGRTF